MLSMYHKIMRLGVGVPVDALHRRLAFLYYRAKEREQLISGGMIEMRKTLMCLAVLIAFALVSPVLALPITFPDAGTLHIKFVGSDAGYDDYFGIVSPFSQDLGMNHVTPLDTEWTIGHIEANDPVILYLSVSNEGQTYVSDPPASNPDTLEHISITDLSGGVKQVGWEDLLGGGDNDMNDVILNVWVVPDPIPTPEFPTMALPAALIVGMLGAVLFIQRSKEN